MNYGESGVGGRRTHTFTPKQGWDQKGILEKKSNTKEGSIGYKVKERQRTDLPGVEGWRGAAVNP